MGLGAGTCSARTSMLAGFLVPFTQPHPINPTINHTINNTLLITVEPTVMDIMCPYHEMKQLLETSLQQFMQDP